MSDVTRIAGEVNELLEELINSNYVEPARPDEVTSTMLAERLKCSNIRASRILYARVQAGELVSRKTRDEHGHIILAYHKAQ